MTATPIIQNDHNEEDLDMYAIEEGLQKINGETVETFCREALDGDTALLVEAGTTGYKGGNRRNAGGRTYFSIVCE